MRIEKRVINGRLSVNIVAFDGIPYESLERRVQIMEEQFGIPRSDIVLISDTNRTILDGARKLTPEESKEYEYYSTLKEKYDNS